MWEVMSNPVSGGKYVYQVYKIRNPREPMHSGNIITRGVFDTEEEAEKRARELNREENDN